MMNNVGHLSFDQMGELIFFPMTVHVNEFLVANILPFIEVVIIAVVHIKVDTTKEKFINVHMRDRCTINFRSCVEGLF